MLRTEKHCNESNETVKTDINQFSSICRGCLATERRMMKTSSYEDMFKDLTGIIISSIDGLPQWLCYECSAMLHKCIKFRNKIMKSHYKLCQYMLESVPFDLDVDATPHLSRSIVLHCHIAGSHDNQLEKLGNDAIKCESDVPVSIIQTESVQVKDESMSSDREDNIAEAKYSANYDGVFQGDSLKLPIDVMSGVTLKFEEEIEQQELDEQVDDTIEPDTDMLHVTETITSEVKHEPTYSDYEDNTAEQEYSMEIPEMQHAATLSVIDPLDLINVAVNVKHKQPIDHGEASSQEPHLRTEAAQQHLHKHVGASRTWRHDEERQHPADNTSTRHSDDTEEEVNHNIHRDNSAYISSRSNVQSYICDTCNKCFSDKVLLITHIRKHSAEKSFKCDVCYKQFFDDSTLNKHSRVHTAAKLYQCGDKPYKCDVCMKCFGKKSDLNRHMRVHTGDKPVKCDVCMKCFGQKSDLNKHMRVHTGDKPYKCDVCMKVFGHKSHLNSHTRLHTGVKPYKCDVCMKRFNEKAQLNKHMRLHTGDKPYKCDVCFKPYRWKQHLMDHMHKHTGEMPYKCDVCMKCFVRKSLLNRHMRIHTGDKPYRCDVCKKCLGRKFNLIRHMRLHTGDRPYKCDVCMKRFNEKAKLNKHMRLHTGDKPYKCDVCMKCFTQNGGLSRHIRTHTGHKPFKCDVCMKSFCQKKYLEAHMHIHTSISSSQV